MPRDYEKQAGALLKWVQDPKNVYYVNEPGERLQDPLHTLKVGHGDCDDQVLLLTCFYESIGLPWKFVLSGRHKSGQKIRYIEGDQVPSDVSWTHIYCMVGTPPFKPNKWYFCETTVLGVPLGWDVINGDHSFLPEMAKTPQHAPMIMQPVKNGNFRPTPLPPMNQRSPAYAMAYSGVHENPDPGAEIGVRVGNWARELEEEMQQELREDTAQLRKEMTQRSLWIGVATGVAVSVCTALTLDFLKGEGFWRGSGHFMERINRRFEAVSKMSKLGMFWEPASHATLLSQIAGPKNDRLYP